jgi:hypothetical protein
VDYDRSAAYARRFYEWLKENRPELSFAFYWGYSMEHPRLPDTVDFLREIGSPGGKFLQFDGMCFRTEQELHDLLTDLKTVGIRLIDLTFYGTEVYHDRFAARSGDFRLMIDTLRVANQMDLDVSVTVPVTRENAGQIDELLEQLRGYRTARISLFVPHSEGRGALLEPVRLTLDDYEGLSDAAKALFSRTRFRTEGEWARDASIPAPERRVLTLTLTAENMERFEGMDFADTISYLESLDDAYYGAVPPFSELLSRYGDRDGRKLYSARDLYMVYQRRYIRENNLDIYDVNDERQCFSRRI